MVAAIFLALTVEHTQHTFGLFETVEALSWALSVGLELGIAVAAMYTFDQELSSKARTFAAWWLGGLLVASYSLNVVYYWRKADGWGLLLGLIFPASIAVLGAIEPDLREADKRSKEKKTGAIAERNRQALDASLPPSPTRNRQVGASSVNRKAPKMSVRVTKPEPALLPEHVTPSAPVVSQPLDSFTALRAQLDTITPDSEKLIAPVASSELSSASSAGEAPSVKPEDWQALARQLAATGTMSKAEIARAVGKSRQAVSAYLNGLSRRSETEVAV